MSQSAEQAARPISLSLSYAPTPSTSGRFLSQQSAFDHCLESKPFKSFSLSSLVLYKQGKDLITSTSGKKYSAIKHIFKLYGFNFSIRKCKFGVSKQRIISYFSIYSLTTSTSSSETEATILFPYDVKSQLNGSSRYFLALGFLREMTILFSKDLKSSALQLLSIADCDIAMFNISSFVIILIYY